MKKEFTLENLAKEKLNFEIKAKSRDRELHQLLWALVVIQVIFPSYDKKYTLGWLISLAPIFATLALMFIHWLWKLIKIVNEKKLMREVAIAYKIRKECGDISMFSEKVRELAKDFLEMKNKESENE